jgi:3-phosphoglycerate kinase
MGMDLGKNKHKKDIKPHLKKYCIILISKISHPKKTVSHEKWHQQVAKKLKKKLNTPLKFFKKTPTFCLFYKLLAR